jgi:hypothetical protein
MQASDSAINSLILPQIYATGRENQKNTGKIWDISDILDLSICCGRNSQNHMMSAQSTSLSTTYCVIAPHKTPSSCMFSQKILGVP